MAAKSGDRNMVEHLVEEEADIVNIKDHNEVNMEFVVARSLKIHFPFLVSVCNHIYLHKLYQVYLNFCMQKYLP